MNKNRSRRESSAERELERLKKRQEVYMDAMSDLELLRDHYKDVLREKLEEKVSRQREEKEKKKLTIKEKPKPQEIMKQQFSKIRLPRSDGIEDTEFLTNVPASKFYQIIEIQNSMEKRNELNKKHKVEEFYRLISKPEILAKLQKDLRNGHQLTFKRLQELTVTSREEPKDIHKKHNSKVLSPILDQEAESQRGSPMSRKERNSSGDQKNINLDEMFPTVSYPKLPMINRNLESPDPDPLGVEQAESLARRRNDIEERKLQLSSMYKKSIAYEAATGRLMKKYKHLNVSSIHDSDVNDIVEVNEHSQPPPENTKLKTRIKANVINERDEGINSNQNINEYLSSLKNLKITDKYTGQMLFDEEDDIDKGHTASRCTPEESPWKARAHSDATLRDEILGIAKQTSEPPKISPLTMEALEETSVIKIVKGPPKIWINPV